MRYDEISLKDESVKELQETADLLYTCDETIKINDIVRLKQGVDLHWQNSPMKVISRQGVGIIYVTVQVLDPTTKILTEAKYQLSQVTKVE